MKKYNKPTVNVVSLKSSEDIAKLTFDQIRNGFVRDELYRGTYAVSAYTITNSVVKSGTEILDS